MWLLSYQGRLCVLSGVCRETGTIPLSGVWEQERSAYISVGGWVPGGGREKPWFRKKGYGFLHFFLFSLVSLERKNLSGLSLKHLSWTERGKLCPLCLQGCPLGRGSILFPLLNHLG